MFKYEHKSKKWGSVFLHVDPRVMEDTRLEILVEAAEMYLGKEKKRKISGNGYQGMLRTDGKYGLLGCYGGQEFRAELDTEDGKSEISFLVRQQLDPARN